MNRIDYIHPTAVEQIQKAMHGETVPSNDGNRDGMVNDVRYFSEYALNQIRGVDVGPEYNPANYQHYTAVFASISITSLDPIAFGIKVEGVVPFPNVSADGNQFVTLSLTDVQAQTIIGTAVQAAEPLLGTVLCFVVKDCPADILPQVGDIITPDTAGEFLLYSAIDRQLTSPNHGEIYIDYTGYTVYFARGIVSLGNFGIDMYAIDLPIEDAWLTAKGASAIGISNPSKILSQYRFGREDGSFTQFRVSFNDFDLPTPTQD